MQLGLHQCQLCGEGVQLLLECFPLLGGMAKLLPQEVHLSFQLTDLQESNDILDIAY